MQILVVLNQLFTIDYFIFHQTPYQKTHEFSYLNGSKQ